MRPYQWQLAVLIAALGYFVDVYDIILFSTVRVASLESLGYASDEITSKGLWLMNIQVIGMLIGGVLWGIMADKWGRLSVLLGSILLYSLATFLNAWVSSFEQYIILRGLAGIGLAGELGAGVTLVSELMKRQTRGYGGTIIISAGALGGLAGGIAGHYLAWQSAYIVGGVSGLGLLFLRFNLKESPLFTELKNRADIAKGSLLLLFQTKALLSRYGLCLCVGMPFWLFVGLFLTLAPELGRALCIEEAISTGMAMIYFCGALIVGEYSSNALSQALRSRRKAIFSFLMLSLFISLIMFTRKGMTSSEFYSYCTFLGFSNGFWVMFIMMAVEQFGTNLRATVTTSLPNFVRGMMIPFSMIVSYLKPSMGILSSVGFVCITVLGVACWTVMKLKETYSCNLDFIEV